MKPKNLFLGIILLAISAGCYRDDVDLINIEVKEDLATVVQIVVSPVNKVESEEDPYQGFSSGEAEQREKEEYFLEKKDEFESCGFTARRNLRYDESGVSGSQTFSSRTELEEAFSCLSFVTSQQSPIELTYPSKTENLLQENYQLRVGFENPNIAFGYGSFLGNRKPVNEIRVSLPGRIDGFYIENKSSNLIVNESQSDSGVLTINIDGVDVSKESNDRIAQSLFDQLDIDTSGFDFSRLDKLNRSDDEVQKAEQELFTMFEEQTGIVFDAESEELASYIEARIPFYSFLVVKSSASKIDTGTAVTLFLGLLPFVIGFPVFLYNNRKKKSK